MKRNSKKRSEERYLDAQRYDKHVVVHRGSHVSFSETPRQASRSELSSFHLKLEKSYIQLL